MAIGETSGDKRVIYMVLAPIAVFGLVTSFLHLGRLRHDPESTTNGHQHHRWIRNTSRSTPVSAQIQHSGRPHGGQPVTPTSVTSVMSVTAPGASAPAAALSTPGPDANHTGKVLVLIVGNARTFALPSAHRTIKEHLLQPLRLHNRVEVAIVMTLTSNNNSKQTDERRCSCENAEMLATALHAVR